MNRRRFVTTTAAAGLASSAAAADNPAKSSIYELRFFYMRNGTEVERTTAYLRDAWLPAAKRAAIGPVGFFSPVIGGRAPFILALASYNGFAAIESAHAKFAADREYQKGWDAYNTMGDPAYIRIESTLLRAFEGIPTIEVPPTDGKRAARIFELRTYESVNEKASDKKVGMFESGEAAVFKRLGMSPVFFGQGIVGNNLPSLTYMLAFDDLAARERLWRAFGSDPEWQKLRTQPGLSDAEIVSNINSMILRPLPFSPIR
jgi:hypothetical protein